MRIHLLPIEPLDTRYTAQWYRWWPTELRRLGHEVNMIDGERLTQGISRGQFLDVIDTNYYKASQLQAVAKQWHAGQIKDGDVFLLLDAWNPCAEQLAYMRDALGAKVTIAGLLHAGTYDPSDYISKVGMGRWAAKVEEGW